MTKLILLEPEQLPDGGLRVGPAGAGAEAHPAPGGWTYTRSGADSITLAGRAPIFEMDLPAGHAVARLSCPLVVPPKAKLPLWIAWPLEIRALIDETVVIDRFVPGARATLIGNVTDGKVFPAVMTEILSGPTDAALEGRPLAALQVEVSNGDSTPSTIQRVVIDGDGLELFRKDGWLCAGVVRVRLAATGTAETESKRGKPPAGFEALPRSPRRPKRATTVFGWLLHAAGRPED